MFVLGLELVLGGPFNMARAVLRLGWLGWFSIWPFHWLGKLWAPLKEFFPSSRIQFIVLSQCAMKSCLHCKLLYRNELYWPTAGAQLGGIGATGGTTRPTQGLLGADRSQQPTDK